VVFVATGHGGAPVATLFLGRFVQALIRPSDELRDIVYTVVRENGRRVIQRGLQARRFNGVGEMRPRDPILRAVDRAGIDPAVSYYSIIPQLHVGPVRLWSDGIVPYWSSRIDGAASETITRGFHTSEGSRPVTAEIKRILCEHLSHGAPACRPSPDGQPVEGNDG
jgi:hypothetical protein